MERLPMKADQRSQYSLLIRSKSVLFELLFLRISKSAPLMAFKVEKRTSSSTPAFGQTSAMILGSWTIVGGSMLHGRGPNTREFSSETGEHWKEVSYGRGRSRIAMKLSFHHNKQFLTFSRVSEAHTTCMYMLGSKSARIQPTVHLQA